MENKVIAKEYVDKNYIHKDVIREMVDNRENSIDDIYSNLEINMPMLKEIRRLQIETDILKELLEDK